MELRRDNAELRQENVELREEDEELRRANAEQRRQIAELRQNNEALVEQKAGHEHLFKSMVGLLAPIPLSNTCRPFFLLCDPILLLVCCANV
jgi:FtsZ-binding cell division protein ZapB